MIHFSHTAASLRRLCDSWNSGLRGDFEVTFHSVWLCTRSVRTSQWTHAGNEFLSRVLFRGRYVCKSRRRYSNAIEWWWSIAAGAVSRSSVIILNLLEWQQFVPGQTGLGTRNGTSRKPSPHSHQPRYESQRVEVSFSWIFWPAQIESCFTRLSFEHFQEDRQGTAFNGTQQTGCR